MGEHDYPGARDPDELDDAPASGDSHPDYFYETEFEEAPIVSVGDDGGAWQPPDGGTSALLDRLRWGVYLLAFLIPLGLLAIVLGVLAWRDGDSAAPGSPAALTATPAQPPTETGNWPDDVIFVPHTVPAMIRDDLPVAGARLGYRFNGGTGQIWLITVAAQSDGFDPQITLYAPSGAALASSEDRAAGDVTAELLVLLPESGAYRLLVEGAGNTTGTYLLTLYRQQ